MPPTRHMNGNPLRTHACDTLFNLVTVATEQGMQTIGVPTEGVFTPHIHDRMLALENVDYVETAARGFADEIEFKRGGLIESHAHDVLGRAHELLEEIAESGLFAAIEAGRFGDVRRHPDEGRGAEGIVAIDDGYFNPLAEVMRVSAVPDPRRARARRPSPTPTTATTASSSSASRCRCRASTPPASRRWRSPAAWASRAPRSSTTSKVTDGYTYLVLYGRFEQRIEYEAVRRDGFESEHMTRTRSTRSPASASAARSSSSAPAPAPTPTASASTRCSTSRATTATTASRATTAFDTHNLGSQVPNTVLVAGRWRSGADAIVVSQTVTQQDLHIHNLTELVEMVEAEGIRARTALDLRRAADLRRAGQGARLRRRLLHGTFPNHLATFLVRALAAEPARPRRSPTRPQHERDARRPGRCRPGG